MSEMEYYVCPEREECLKKNEARIKTDDDFDHFCDGCSVASIRKTITY